ncbi:MAG TPA: tRNA lysidine(34) synthetase TilS [Candidatus Limnocylindria bacterium]|nr:tRNA lysidine(34) synthetase TilS [Candidatus Limnocylindria bacterium]
MAGGSNPPSATSPPDPIARLAAAVARGTDALQLPSDAPFVLAVSGGPDSTALLHGAARLMADGARAWKLTVAHLDHGLRDGSATDAARVGEVAAGLGLAFRTSRTDIAALARDEGRSLEDAGRQARYRFLEDVAGGAGPDALIATAHTADDLAETILLRIVRGSGLRGLRGIPARRGRVVRPLLAERRTGLREALDQAGISYLLDPTNDDPSYAERNRIRSEVLPALERINPRAVDALLRLSANAAADDDLLDALAAAELARRRSGGGIDWHDPPHRAIGRRVMRLAAGDPAPSAERIEALLDAAEGPRGGLTVELGGGREATVRERRIVFGLPVE